MAMRNYHIAYDRLWKVQSDIIALMQSTNDGIFGSRPLGQLYPENWPDVTSALYNRIPSTDGPAIQLGISLRNLDSVIEQYLSAITTDERKARIANVRSAVSEASQKCTTLYERLKTR